MGRAFSLGLSEDGLKRNLTTKNYSFYVEILQRLIAPKKVVSKILNERSRVRGDGRSFYVETDLATCDSVCCFLGIGSTPAIFLRRKFIVLVLGLGGSVVDT